jgi:hypothetical protein
MCGVPLPWWVEEIEKDKEKEGQEQNTPDTDTEECD